MFEVLQLRLAETGEVLEPTAPHRFSSETRQDWVPAGELQIGESLHTATGQSATVESLALKSGQHRVYNLEVEQEHQFYVGETGVLVHNACTWDTTAETPWGRTVHRRSDIDWDYVRPDGRTNAQAAADGYTPMRPNGRGGYDYVVLHHSNNDPGSNVFEVWSNTHNARHAADRLNGMRLASGDARGVPDPVLGWREAHHDWANNWNTEQSVYWKWTQGAYTPPPGAIQVPPSLLPQR